MSNTAVTVQVIDPTGQEWTNGELTYQLFAGMPVYFNGTELPLSAFLPVTIELDDTGSATFNVMDNGQMTPSGCVYRITVNPNAYTQGITLYLYITGATMNISTQVNAAIAQPIVLPLVTPFGYRDTNIELQNGVGEMYWNVGTETPGLRLFTGTEWITIGGAGVTQIVAGTNITIDPTSGVGVVTINATGGGGITGLNGDVLAGTSPFTSSTCVMVHAEDTEDNTLQIDTQLPPYPDAATDSIGLWGLSPNKTYGPGAVSIFFDDDFTKQWVLFLQDSENFGHTYLYSDTMPVSGTAANYLGVSQLHGTALINDAGTESFFFGNSYDLGSSGHNNGWFFTITGFNNPPNQCIGYLTAGDITDWKILVSETFAIDATIGNSGSARDTGRFLFEYQNSGLPSGSGNRWRLQTNTGGEGGGTWGLAVSTGADATINSQFVIEGIAASSFTNDIVFDPTGKYSGLNIPTIETIAWNAGTPENVALAIKPSNGQTLFYGASGTLVRTISDPALTNITGSVTPGTPFQNTSGQEAQYSGWMTTIGSSTGTTTISIGPTSTSLTAIWNFENTASVSGGDVGFIFKLPAGWWFEITATGDDTGLGACFQLLY